MSLTPALFVSARPDDTDPGLIQPSSWNRLVGLVDSLLDGADANGSLLWRNTSDVTDGGSWLAPVGSGSVLVSAGVAAAPAWSAAPTLSNAVWSLTNGATQVIYDKHDPTITGTIGTAAGNVGGVTFGRMYQPVRWTQGPGGEPNYIDDTWHLGMNLGTNAGGLGRADVTKPNLALSFETKFYASGAFGQEFHLQGVTADGLTSYRPLSFYLAHDASIINGALAVDVWTVANKAGVSLMQASNANGALDLGTSSAPVKLRFNKNNVSAIQQINALGNGFIDLLYLDGSNVAQIGASTAITGPRIGQNFVLVQPATASNNDTAIAVGVPTFTGVYQGLKVVGSVTGKLQCTIENDQASAGGAHASLTLQVSDGTGGDPYIYFNTPGVTNWSFGLDNSDSDNLVWSAASTLGASNAMKLTTAGALTITSTVATAAGVAWNLGALSTGLTGQALDTTKSVAVTIGGVSVKLAVLQ